MKILPSWELYNISTNISPWKCTVESMIQLSCSHGGIYMLVLWGGSSRTNYTTSPNISLFWPKATFGFFESFHIDPCLHQVPAAIFLASSSKSAARSSEQLRSKPANRNSPEMEDETTKLVPETNILNPRKWRMELSEMDGTLIFSLERDDSPFEELRAKGGALIHMILLFHFGVIFISVLYDSFRKCRIFQKVIKYSLPWQAKS